MQRDVAIGLMRRAITIAENQWPEMADAPHGGPARLLHQRGGRGEGARAVRDVTAGARRRDRDREPARLPRAQRGRSLGAASPATRTASPTRSSTTAATAAPSPRRDAATSAGSRARTTRGSTTRRASSSACRCATATTASTCRTTGSSSCRARSGTASSGSCCGAITRSTSPRISASSTPRSARSAATRCSYYSSIAEAPLAANWKSVAEGLLEGLHVPYVHADTFNLNPQAVNVDLAFYDAIGPHVRWGLPMFGQDEAERLREHPRGRVAPRGEHRLHLADLTGPAARQRALRDHLRRSVPRRRASTSRTSATAG